MQTWPEGWLSISTGASNSFTLVPSDPKGTSSPFRGSGCAGVNGACACVSGAYACVSGACVDVRKGLVWHLAEQYHETAMGHNGAFNLGWLLEMVPYLSLVSIMLFGPAGYWTFESVLNILNGAIPPGDVCTTFWEGLVDSSNNPLRSISTFRCIRLPPLCSESVRLLLKLVPAVTTFLPALLPLQL